MENLNYTAPDLTSPTISLSSSSRLGSTSLGLNNSFMAEDDDGCGGGILPAWTEDPVAVNKSSAMGSELDSY